MRPLLFLLVLGACAPQGSGGWLEQITGPKAATLTAQGHELLEADAAEAALKSYYRAAARDGLDAERLSGIGTANLRLGRLGQAEKMLRRAIDMDPNFVPALNNLGVVKMEQGDYGEAARLFKQAAALDNGDTDRLRENLAKAESKLVPPASDPAPADYKLLRAGGGQYLLKKN